MNKQNKDIDSDTELNDDSIQKIHDELLNEKELPKEGFSFLPIFLIFAFAGICFWGGIYIVNHGGAFRWDAYDPDFVVHDKPLAIPEKSLFEIGQKLFVIANGKGLMYGLKDRLTNEQSWSIVLYLRALQRAQNADQSDLSLKEKSKLGL